MSPFRLPAIACTFLLTGVPGHAEITITESDYAAGVLVVRGQTSQSHQQVILDGRYNTDTDSGRQFVFRVRYLPPGCTADIRAGGETRQVDITNCSDAGNEAPKSPSAR